MGPALLAVLYAVVLAAAWASAQAPGAGTAQAGGRRPWATPTALVVVGVPSLVQLAVAPELLGWLRRMPGELGRGELWRLVTSLVVQDGGWPGTVFNLVELAVLGFTAERVWGSRAWVGIWLAAGVGAQFWGLVVQPVGGGNSVATFGLAASLAVRAVLRGRAPARLCGAASLITCAVLLMAGDIHGGAAVIGAVAALVLARPRAAAPAGLPDHAADPAREG